MSSYKQKEELLSEMIKKEREKISRDAPVRKSLSLSGELKDSIGKSVGKVTIDSIVKVGAGPCAILMKVGHNLWNKFMEKAEKQRISISELMQKMFEKI